MKIEMEKCNHINTELAVCTINYPICTGFKGSDKPGLVHVTLETGETVDIDRVASASRVINEGSDIEWLVIETLPFVSDEFRVLDMDYPNDTIRYIYKPANV